MPLYDERIYAQAMAKCVFAIEPWRGHIQDVSRFQRPMQWTFTTGSVARCGHVLVTQAPAGIAVYPTGGALISPPADATMALSCEYYQLQTPPIRVGNSYIRHQPANGGFNFYPAGANFYLVTYTAAGAVARHTGAIALPTTASHRHLIATVDPVGLSAWAYINGIPAATTFTNAGVPATGGAATTFSHYSMPFGVLARVFQPALTAAEARVLYAAARALGSG